MRDFSSVRVHQRQNPDLGRIDQVRNSADGAVIVEERVNEVQAHLHAHDFVSMHGRDIFELGLVLLHIRVVRDEHRPEFPPLHRKADVHQPADRGKRRRIGLQFGRQGRVLVIDAKTPGRRFSLGFPRLDLQFRDDIALGNKPVALLGRRVDLHVPGPGVRDVVSLVVENLEGRVVVNLDFEHDHGPGPRPRGIADDLGLRHSRDNRGQRPHRRYSRIQSHETLPKYCI